MKLVALITQVLHAIPLYVHIVRENLSLPNFPDVVTNVRHWWSRDVVTVDDYLRYMLCEDIKEVSSWLGVKRRFDFRKHTKEYLQEALDSYKQAYSNMSVYEENNPIEFHG